MAVRQYIGARYVIKIYENSQNPASAEWEANVNYEPIVMVTFNNGSYLSKKDVPATVGNPADNPAYWVQTGFYNGQIAYLQTQIDGLKAFNTPQMFGAKGDGLTDDTQALQDAIDASVDNTLVIPFGVYRITAPLIVDHAINIIGTSAPARTYRTENGWLTPTSTIIADNIIDCIIGIESDYVTIKNLALNCNNKSASGVSTYGTQYHTRVILENVHVEAATDNGFQLYLYLSTAKVCTAHNCANFGFRVGGSGGMTSLTFESCFADGCATGFRFNHVEYSTLISCAVDHSTNAYRFINDCRNIEMLDCGCEVVDNPVTLDYTTNMTIRNLMIDDVQLVNGTNTNNALIYAETFTDNLIISGLRVMQVSDDLGTFEGYKLYVANQCGKIVILDDSVKYADIYISETNKPDKCCVSFPNELSIIRNSIILDTSTVDNCSCKKVHDGAFLMKVDTVDPNGPRSLFPVATVTLDAGTYIIKGFEQHPSNTRCVLSVATSDYGTGVIARDNGSFEGFTLSATTTIYIAVQINSTAAYEGIATPELFKVV